MRRLQPPSNPPRRSSGARLTGKPLPLLDLPAKSDGSFRFAGDVRLPDMLFAAARLAPPGGPRHRLLAQGEPALIALS